jgi:hypothetical protein
MIEDLRHSAAVLESLVERLDRRLTRSPVQSRQDFINRQRIQGGSRTKSRV